MHELRIILSMMQVPGFIKGDGEGPLPDADNSLSLMQYLLRRSSRSTTFCGTSRHRPALEALGALRSRRYDNKPHSYTPRRQPSRCCGFLPASQVVGVGDGTTSARTRRSTSASPSSHGLHPNAPG